MSLHRSIRSIQKRKLGMNYDLPAYIHSLRNWNPKESNYGS